MKCDVCDQDFANSEELKLHTEREHPIGEGEDEGLEMPDHMDGGPDKSETQPVRPEAIPPR